MAAHTLVWNTPVELAASGNVGGLIHYFTEEAQAFFLNGTDMAMKPMTAPEGQYSAPGALQVIESDNAYLSFKLDHPAFGTVFASWGTGGELVFALYNYATDVSDIVDVEIGEQVDNAVKSLSMTAQNVQADLFDSDMSLFAPGAALMLNLAMGDSAWYPMGKYFLDTAPYDCMAVTHSFQGRSRIGRLLKDNVFDLYNSTTQAVFTGTPAQICTAIITRYSDGELTAADLVIQASSAIYTAKFDPAGSVLQGLTEWLEQHRAPSTASHTTLQYGDTGSEVRTAQKLLNNNMGPKQTKLLVDGDFGPLTQKAVDAFQKAKGLTVTHDIDAATWAALLGGPADAWSLEELYDGRIIIGNSAFIAKYRVIGRYTFTRNVDVFTRSIDRSQDGAFSRVGVKYKSGDADAYKYATVDTWPGWAVPTHRTTYIDAPDGSTAAQAQALADKTAVELQFVGIGEQLYGPIRPELLVGDISQAGNDDGITATVTGLITEVKHKMGSGGYYTTFYSDSGGSIMDVETDDEVPETKTVTTPKKKHPTGGNRKRRLGDAIKKIAKDSGGGGGGGRVLVMME